VSPNGYIIVLNLSHFDLLRLKSNTGVGRSENDTFITISASLIDDTAGVDVVPITDGKAIQVAHFIPDTVPPVLLNYTLDMDLGIPPRHSLIPPLGFLEYHCRSEYIRYDQIKNVQLFTHLTSKANGKIICN